MQKPKKRYTFCYKKNHLKKTYINILYIHVGEMDLQNKIDNLDKQQQAKLAKYISKLEKKQRTKLISKNKKKLEPKKKILQLCLQRIKFMKALMLI